MAVMRSVLTLIACTCFTGSTADPSEVHAPASAAPKLNLRTPGQAQQAESKTVSSHDPHLVTSAQKSLEKHNTIVHAVSVHSQVSADVGDEFAPEAPDAPGGVWDFSAAAAKNGTFATPQVPDPVVVPIGLLSPKRGGTAR